MFEIEYEFREEDLVHFNELQMKSNVDLQKTISRSRLFLPGALLLIGMFYYVYYQDMITTVYISVIAIAWGIFSPYYMKMDMRRQFLNRYTEKEKAGMFGLHTLKIAEEHIAEQSPAGKHKNKWEDMLRVDYLDNYVHIFIDLDSAIVIPRETMKKGDLDKFAKQVESMIERLS